MALSTKEQLLIDLQDDLSNIDSTLQNISNDIGVTIRNKLSDLKDDTGQWLNEFEKGENIVGKLNTKLKAIQKDANKLGLDRIKLEDELKAAIRNGNVAEQNRLDKKILANKLSTKQLEDTQTLIIKLKQAAEAEAKITEEKKKQLKFENLASKAFGYLPSSIATLSGIFKAIIDGALRLNQISVDIGKNLGYSADQADRVANDFKKIATDAENTNITLKNLGEAANELNTATGFVAEYSADALETQIMLTKQFGLTGEEAAGVYRLSILTGKSSKAVNDAMVGAFVATRNQLKVGVPFKATIVEAAKVSGRLAANLQNNPEAIVKAVVATKALGSSLEQASKQGEALLNFESSIESELKAELITGKQLNLERARAAALVGDQITLSQELTNQVGSLEDFQKMNVIQQKSIAEAVGLTADELADQLRKQELAIKNGESLVELTEKEALEAQQRQNIQDKFNNAILKLQDVLGNILSGPLSKLIDGFANLLSSSTGIVAAITALTAISFGKTLASLATMAASLGLSAAGALTTASAISFGIGIVAVIAGLAAAMGAFNTSKEEAVQPVQDGIAMPGRGPFTITDSYGATAITAAGDGLAVSPNINRGENNNNVNASFNLTPMITAINEVRVAIDRLYNKDQSINMDGKKVGTTLVQNTYKLA
jgi:hypothetical protein